MSLRRGGREEEDLDSSGAAAAAKNSDANLARWKNGPGIQSKLRGKLCSKGQDRKGDNTEKSVLLDIKVKNLL